MNLRHHWKTAEAGYSLIELVLVLAITGTLGALATPFFLTYYQASRLRVGAEEVAAFVNVGRQLGIRLNSGACVHIGSAAVQYYVGGTVTEGACACTGACSLWVGPGTDSAGNVKPPEGIGLSASTDFAFSYLGAATPASTITVTNSQTGSVLHVTVAASGRVSIGP